MHSWALMACAVARPYAARSMQHGARRAGVTGYTGGKISACCLVDTKKSSNGSNLRETIWLTANTVTYSQSKTFSWALSSLGVQQSAV